MNYRVFDDLGSFSNAVLGLGFDLDFQSILELNTSFMKSGDKYLVLNVKDASDLNSLLFLSEKEAYLYSKTPPTSEAFEPFEEVLPRPRGKTTIVAFLTLSRVVFTYKERLDSLINGIKELEAYFNPEKYRRLAGDFQRLFDKLEDAHDVALRLEERGIREVETQHISFDYSVLVAEISGSLDRCRNRFNMLKDIARDHETQTTVELNKRIERLNDVVKKLTALTVVLMIPNVISGHFGMNFVFMPELRIPEAYPIVIIGQIILTLASITVFRKIKWL